MEISREKEKEFTPKWLTNEIKFISDEKLIFNYLEIRNKLDLIDANYLNEICRRGLLHKIQD